MLLSQRVRFIVLLFSLLKRAPVNHPLHNVKDIASFDIKKTLGTGSFGRVVLVLHKDTQVCQRRRFFVRLTAGFFRNTMPSRYCARKRSSG